MDTFRLHAFPVGELEELLQSAAAAAPNCSAHSLEFYQGSIPILLKPLPSDDETGDAAAAEIPLNVMQFHTTMLPPNTNASIEGGPSEGFDRLADAEQVELFGHNVVLPSVALLEGEAATAGSAMAVDSGNPTAVATRRAPPHDASCSALLFPSLLEGNITAEQWKVLIRDGPMLDRIHYSYTIMLHYYGWRLHNEETGEIDRHQNWRARYEALSSTQTSISSPLRLYAVWTRMLRVLLELRMPNYVGRWMRFLLEEFKNDRLLFLLPVWDSVWFPYVGDGKLLFPETIVQLRKYRRKLDVHTSSDEDEQLFGSE
jgi:hypothetical protein